MQPNPLLNSLNGPDWALSLFAQGKPMEITFSGRYTVNSDTFGINFEANVDGTNVVCSISTEALDDVDTINAQSAPEHQFLANRVRFEAIAEQKIRAGISPVAINSSDVHS